VHEKQETEARIMGEGNSESAKRPARVAIFGYGPDAREQAMRLRAIGREVDVVVRPGGMSWIRAVADGFRPFLAGEAVRRAAIVSIQLPEAAQATVWAYDIAPYLASGTLVVFAQGSALYLGAIEPEPRFDVVLITRGDGPDDPGTSGAWSTPAGTRGCRVAVHHNASGHALERAAAFARDVCGASKVGTTTLESEVRYDLSQRMAKVGGLAALLAEWDRVLANASHEPDEATLRYYERLRAAVLEGARGGIIKPPASQIELPAEPNRIQRNRGAA
jgi:ketol-acid reductoisomerase